MGIGVRAVMKKSEDYVRLIDIAAGPSGRDIDTAAGPVAVWSKA